jgi:hypothetical protein
VLRKTIQSLSSRDAKDKDKQELPQELQWCRQQLGDTNVRRLSCSCLLVTVSLLGSPAASYAWPVVVRLVLTFLEVNPGACTSFRTLLLYIHMLTVLSA